MPVRISPALLVAWMLISCSDSPTPDVAPPDAIEQDLAPSESAARRVEQDLAALVLEPLARGRIEPATRGMHADSFAARLPRLDAAVGAGALRARPVRSSDEVATDPLDFAAALHALNPTEGDPARVECEVERFELSAEGTSATGLARMRWAGTTADARGDATLYADVRMVLEGNDWLLAGFEPAGRSAARPNEFSAGVVVSGDAPRFVNRAHEAGLTFGTSPDNRELMQAFVDRHRTLTLGGLSVRDVDGDDRPDLIATRSEEATIVFRNDGVSGFVPEPFPIVRRAERPAFALFVDLDGDGQDELVASEASDYEGERAFAGIWTRSGSDDGIWRHLPRALAMPNRVGLRRLAVQTVCPFDADLDGDLDLFFAVYGTAESRGEHYNTVEAYDGADNHLFINQGELNFTEESEARGIHGTGYTYVALAFDVDRDGDADLFEGNDFGPNVLWRNDGGTFVADDRFEHEGVSAYTMGAALADLDATGRWDLYVSNMSSEQGMRIVPHAPDLSDAMRQRVDVIARGNMLYREGAGGRWTECAAPLAIADGEWAWGCQFLDADGDGAQELFVTNGFASHRDRTLPDWQTYYWRQVVDDAVRLERGEKSRDVNASLRFRGSFNGHEHDRLYVRTDGEAPDRPWVDGGWLFGLDRSHDGRAAVPIDYDGDGDLDLALWALSGLVLNENRSDPLAWTRLRLLDGNGAAALGARVMIEAGDQRVARHVAIVEGFQSQVSTDVHASFGAADGRTLDRILVTWPDGTEEEIDGAPTERLLIIRRGEGLVEARELPRWSERGPVVEPGGWSELAQLARLPGTVGMPADYPLVVHLSVDGIATLATEAALEVATQHARVVRARLRGAATPDAARGIDLEPERFADWIGASEESTVVFDGRGDVLRVVRGSVDAETLFAFLELARDERPHPHLLIEHGRLALDEARYRDALALFTEATRERDDLSMRDAAAFEGLGRSHVLLGRVDLAEDAYRRSIEVDPDYALGHLNLGVSLTHQGRFDEAVESLREARRIDGDTVRVLGPLLDAAAAADQTELALKVGEAFATLAPAEAGPHVVMGKVEARAGRFAKAIERFDRALELRPGDPEATAGRTKARELLSQ